MSETFGYQQWEKLRTDIELAVGGVPYRPILELMYFYTRRADAVLSMRESDVDFEDGLITFPVNWRNVDTEITFRLDHRTAESLATYKQLKIIRNRSEQRSSEAFFDLSYSALLRKIKDTARTLRFDLKPKSVRSSRVEHLLDSGYHPEQVEHWMAATPGRLREKQDITSLVHQPLVLEKDDLYGNSPDVPRHRSSFLTDVNERFTDAYQHPPLPPLVVDADDISTVVARTVPGTPAYETRRILYERSNYVERSTLVEELRETEIQFPEGGEVPRLDRVIDVLVETGEVIRNGGRYKWNRWLDR